MNYWHFLPNDGCLQYDSHEKVVTKHTYMLPSDVKIIPCSVGFHGSIRAIDALQYAPGSIVSLCTLHGTILPHGYPVDKYAAQGRTHLWIADADATLQEFTRWCALSVVHLWAAPQIVLDYLNTGDRKLRDAARATAYAAVCDASWGAARAAARVAAYATAWDAAYATAWDAARATAWDAAYATAWDAAYATAWDAAGAAARPITWNTPWDAARAAARDGQNTKLTEMLMKLNGE